MPAPILTLPGKVDADGALVVFAESSAAAGGSGGVTGTLSALQGKVDAENRLVVRAGA